VPFSLAPPSVRGPRPHEDAFHLLSRYSQNTNQRVRKVSARLVQGLISAAEFRSS